MPTLQYRNLRAAHLRLLKVLEHKYGFRAVTMIHRQEKVSIFGIPAYRFIDVDDSETIIRAVRSTPPNKPLILHTPGGLVLAAAQIAMALKSIEVRK